MKKILCLTLTLVIMVSTCSFAYARGRKPEKKKVKQKQNITSIQKGIQSISPNNNTQANAQIDAQIQNIKNTIESNNTLNKQILVKKNSVMKLIVKIRKNKQSLNNDQYTTISNLLTSIANESKNITQIKGINGMGFMGNLKKSKKYNNLNTQDLTNIQNTLNQNAAHLKNISASYDSITAILTNVASTTPSAINLPITTQSAVSN